MERRRLAATGGGGNGESRHWGNIFGNSIIWVVAVEITNFYLSKFLKIDMAYEMVSSSNWKRGQISRSKKD